MKIADSIFELLRLRSELDKSIGFVPTMGALHEGHAELLRRSKAENKTTILSVFVNPTQFNDPKDFEKYPNTLAADTALAEKNGVDILWLPRKEELYNDKYRFRISENDFSHLLEGRARPGHFDGVLTVVLKLFQVVKPDRAYFGEKDYQQMELIRDMTESFFLPIEIVAVPTVRDQSGLALSSRNQRLSPEAVQEAAKLYQTLNLKITSAEATMRLQELGFKVDYVKDYNKRRYAAVFLEDVRLIDNVEL